MTRTKEAIILVGGLGTRLRTLVSDVPKPLALVAGRPFLAWVLDRLAEQGIERVIMATGYLARKVSETIGPSWEKMAIDYSVEDSPLGTGGAIARATKMLCEPRAYVMNGDTYLQYSLLGMESALEESGADISVALACVPNVERYGKVQIQGDRISQYGEKSGRGNGFINAGNYLLTERCITRLPHGKYSFEEKVLPELVLERKAFGYVNTSMFIDIGVPEDYARAQLMFREE